MKELNYGHRKKVNAFCMVGEKVWSAGDDNIICVWDSKVTSESLNERLKVLKLDIGSSPTVERSSRSCVWFGAFWGLCLVIRLGHYNSNL